MFSAHIARTEQCSVPTMIVIFKVNKLDNRLIFDFILIFLEIRNYLLYRYWAKSENIFVICIILTILQ